jgi:curved DNA-binding protein CbpA
MTFRAARESASMKSLYDLLDVRPDDDAERLKQAFRKAVKASHPDIHTDDPDAPTRFRHFVRAYAILRDPERRADYDRLLELEREQLRSKSYTMRKFVSDAIAVAGLVVVMAGGYRLYPHISKTFVEAVAVVEVPARGPPEIAAVEPAARTDTTDRDEPRGKLAGVEVFNMATAPSAVASAATIREALGIADGGPTLSSAGRDTEIAKIANAFDAPVDQADTMTAADDLKKNSGIEPLDQKKVRSVEVQLSSLEEDGDVPKSSWSDIARSGVKRDTKTRDMKTPERPRMVAKRQATSQTPLKQVSLEGRNTLVCSGSQSCSSHLPPVFGVGY